MAHDWEGCVDGRLQWVAELKLCQLADFCMWKEKCNNELNLFGCQENNARASFIWPMLIRRAKAICGSFLALCLPPVSGY